MRQAFPGKTLKAVEMLGQVQVLTISAVTMETFGDDTIPVVHFYEIQQGLTMNKTKNEVLINALGPESAAWVGHQIQLTTGKTTYQGKLVDCIDVSLPGAPVAPPVAAYAAPGAPPVAPPVIPGQVPGQPAYAAPVAPVAPVAPGSVPPPAPMAPPAYAAVPPPAPAAPAVPGQAPPGYYPPPA